MQGSPGACENAFLREVELKVSEKFHNRFWIAHRSRGLFIGTSLNGLGKRYALAVYTEPYNIFLCWGNYKGHDVKTIVEALSMEELLPQNPEVRTLAVAGAAARHVRASARSKGLISYGRVGAI